MLNRHQLRVIEEAIELGVKYIRLRDFIATDCFQSLSTDEQGRLQRQRSIMNDYASVLRERIAAFHA